MDAIVIGAGPGGCATAWHLRRLGWQVLLLERKFYPTDKLCGEFLSYDGVASIDRMGLLRHLKQAGGECVPEVLVSGMGGVCWRADLPAPGLGVSRRVLDEIMARDCEVHGVEFVQGVQVRQVEGNLSEGFVVKARNGDQYSARLVIAACGRQGGLLREPLAKEPTSNCMALKVQAPCPANSHCIELHGFPGGYAGLCAIEGGRATLGLLLQADQYRASGGNLELFARSVMRENSLLADRLDRLDPPWAEAMAVAALRFGAGQTSRSDVLFVGDMAGSINPLCGDGMSMAMRGGELLAPLADRFLLGEVQGDGLVGEWARIWRREFNTRIRLGKGLEYALLRPRLTRLALKSFTAWPWLGRAALHWSRGRKDFA